MISLSGSEYTLTRDGAEENAASTGDLDMTNPDVLVEGTAVDDANVRSIHLDRVFDVRAGGGLTLTHVSIQEGMADRGGCIRNLGTLVLDRVTVKQCLAAFGGGLYNDGTAMTVRNSTIMWNSGETGGGVALYAPARFESTTIHHNQSDSGGGIFAGIDGEIEMVNCTVSSNRSGGDAGGIGLSESTSIRSSTIVDNTAEEEGGGLRVSLFGAATLTLANSIVAGNTSFEGGPDCNGELTLAGTNLVQDTTDCTLGGNVAGALTGVSPKLEPLGAQGGPVWTHALPSTSPAVDAGDAAGCTDTNGAALATDARGEVRAVDGRCTGTARCDLGAYERPATRDDDADGAIFASCPGGTDCDDADADVHPGVLDVCDGVDNDCTGAADDALGCSPVAGALLDVKDRSPRSVAFRGRGRKLPLAGAGEAADPTCHGAAGGAVLEVFGLDDSDQAASLVLPCAGWTAKRRGNRVVGYVYKDAGQQNGPCRSVKLAGASVTARCAGAAIGYDLVDRGERSVGLKLTTGAVAPAAGARQYCARFERRSVKRDDATRFLARGAAAPAVCPTH